MNRSRGHYIFEGVLVVKGRGGLHNVPEILERTTKLGRGGHRSLYG